MWEKIQVEPVGSNMTKLTIGPAQLFFSYETLVAANINGECVKTSTRHSNTTTRHISKFGAGMWPPHPNITQFVEEKMKGIKL